MLAEIIVGVSVLVIGAAILGGFHWLRDAKNRKRIRNRIRQLVCRHEWEKINKPGETVVLVSGYEEWCVKCGARR